MPRDPILSVRMGNDLRALALGVAEVLDASLAGWVREDLRRRLLAAIDDPDVFRRLADVPGRGNLQGLAIELQREEAKAARLREVETEFDSKAAP